MVRLITPTEDGVLIDCHGHHRTWGCGCEWCLARGHPLDLGARMSTVRLAEYGRMSAVIDRSISQRCIACHDIARLYPGGWWCDEHAPATHAD